MKKLYLLYPPISKMERYASDVGSVGGEQIPLGIYYLASFMRQSGYSVKVVDAEAYKLTVDRIIGHIKKWKPDFVGISSTTVAFHRALEVAEEIKKQCPKTVLILGGPHVTSNYRHAMSFGVFDYGVLREGEYTLKELLDRISEGKPAYEIPGICYMNGTEVVCNQYRDYIQNLDVLPMPAYDLIKNMKLYTPPPSNYKEIPVANIITSRGCPSQCTFCDRNVFGTRYRERSAQNVFEEIKYLTETYGVREIAFVDDTFLINKKRIYELFELLQKNNIFFPWTCMSRINNVDRDFLKFLKSTGCWHIAFGVESGDEEILRRIKKNITLKRADEVIGWCRELGIKTKGFFIVGHPGETLQTINKTIKFACKLKLDDCVVTINTPIPGSPQYAEAEKYGTLDSTDWAKFNCWRPVFVPHGLSEEILLEKQKEFYKSFYLRPQVFLRYIQSFFSSGGLKRFITIIKVSGYLFKKQQNDV